MTAATAQAFAAAFDGLHRELRLVLQQHDASFDACIDGLARKRLCGREDVAFLYGTHSLRRTKAAPICKYTGNLRAVQILLGHTKIESTVRYLGVDIEDALTLAERTEI